MKKLTITLVFSLACAPFFAQTAATEAPKMGSGSAVQGEKEKYPEAKKAVVTPQIKATANNGGVKNKQEILAKKNKNAGQQIDTKPVISAGTKPKNN